MALFLNLTVAEELLLLLLACITDKFFITSILGSGIGMLYDYSEFA